MVKQKIEKQAAIIPDGAYRAVLTNISQFKNHYGLRIGFEFTLQDGGVDGAKIMQSTAPHLSAYGKLAGVVRGVLGRDLIAEDLQKDFDAGALIGRECRVLVMQARNKAGVRYSTIERVFPAAS